MSRWHYVTLVALLILYPDILDDYYVSDTNNESSYEQIVHIDKNEIDNSKPAHIVFVGDIMLARGVEQQINYRGQEDIVKGVSKIISASDIAIGNFEGSIPEVHTETPSMTFQFSVQRKQLEILRKIGFNVLSLANNHSYDYGNSGYVHTASICEAHYIVCVGTPNSVDDPQTITFTLHDKRVGIVFAESVLRTLSTTTLHSVVSSLNTEVDMTFVYIHWGDEYKLVHNTTQQQLAYTAIDAGADLIIGHHPHVVQDVELYNSKLIVYSLGNFIFDQYFNNDVREGLILAAELHEKEILVSLMGVSSYDEKATPKPMSTSSSAVLIDRILNADHVQESQKGDIRTIAIPF